MADGGLDNVGAIDKLRQALAQADAVVIGAGAGLSTSAGFTYGGERFQKYFGDFAIEYGFQDMYTGGFYPFASLEEKWGYWSRNIFINRYMDAPKPVYEQLLEVVRQKDYFVLTTNVDHCFQKAGFAKERLFYTQGDFGLFQCTVPCYKKTYDNEAAVKQMVAKQKERKIPTELIPYCPICGKPMTMNLRTDDTFVEDEGWHEASNRYKAFLRAHQKLSVLFWELGTGMNTPRIIKFPFWQMTYSWTNAQYACINLQEAYAPADIYEKSICINEDIGDVLSKL